MVVAIPPAAISVVFAAVLEPSVVLLTLVPALVVVGAFLWLDRVEPSSWTDSVHAFLWGASVAAFVAALANDTVAFVAGERWALVVSAPLVEEIVKGVGVAVAVRRVRGWFDGVVRAGLVAAGFALVENSAYFLEAWFLGELPQVFVLRGLVTPFAHPLFTVFTGASLGSFGSASWRGWSGLPVAVLLHAVWNGGSLFASIAALGVYAGFVVLFFVVAGVLVAYRRRSTMVPARIAGVLAFRFGFDPFEIAPLLDWKSVVRTRRGLNDVRLACFEDLRRAAATAAQQVLDGVEPTPDSLASLRAARAAFSAPLPPPPVA